MSEHEKITQIIRKQGFFKSCDDDFVERLARQSYVQISHKNHLLLLHQDPADKFYIILSGWIKLFRETLDGAQAIVDILPSGHMFGETSIFEGDTYPYNAEAVEPTELLVLPLDLLKKEIKDNPNLAMEMLSTMARYRRQQDEELEHRTLQNAPQRIGCFLLRLTNQKATGPIIIHLPYDKTLVASRLGMQPETFSRALNKLKAATGIKVKGATIELKDLDQLAQYSCAACSSSFPCKDLEAQSA